MLRLPRYLVLIALLNAMTMAQAQEPARITIFSSLRQGQKITLKETREGRFEILVLKDAPGVSKIVEIGQDYIVVEDTFGFTELRIPVTSISVIRSIKMPR